MTTYPLRKLLVDIALRDVGKTEESRNRAPFIKRYWPATSYPEGYANREPYCAAAVAYWVREWLNTPDVAAAFGKTPAQLEKWRCKSAAAFGWQDWAMKNGLLVMNDNPTNVLHTGDVVVYDFSHVGILVDDYRDRIVVVEANTGNVNQRDGDGVFQKDRPREIARAFIRLLP